MKIKKLIPVLLILPLIGGCNKDKDQEEKKGELEIPTVDVESITPVLPTRPTYNVGNPKTDETFDYIDFYEVSDFHGAVNEESDKIGLAKLADYLNIKRKQNPGGTVVVSSGDMFQGSAESNLTRGYMVNYAMNYMGFDSMAIGNHEFDWTDTWIKKNADLEYSGVKIPYISANIVEKASGLTPEFISKSTVVTRGDYKIGIVGSIGETLASSILASCVENYKFIEEKAAVESEAARLKSEEDCDIVILTSHNDVDALTTLDFTNIDAVFGGHAHVDKNTYAGTVPLVQTANYGKSVAHIQLKINKTTKEVACEANELDDTPLSLSGLSANQDVVSIMNNYTPALSNIKDIKLAKTNENLRFDGALKGICVEGMYQGALKGITESNLNITSDQILATFHNVNGGIRSDINKGDITYGSVYSAFPFDNEIVLYKLTGNAFKNKISKYSAYAVRREFNAVADIVPTNTYYIVLTDFLALSNSYFKSVFNIEESELIRTGKVVRDEVANFIYKEDNIKPSKFMASEYPYKTISAF